MAKSASRGRPRPALSERLVLNQPRLVLVEGNDDVRVINALARRLGIQHAQVEAYGGTSGLSRFLDALPDLAGFEAVRSLAVVMDANSNRSAAEDRVRDALRDAGFPCPIKPLQACQEGNLTVTYLIVPHGRETGMMEDVCLESVRDDPALQCVDDFLRCVGETALPGPRDASLSKARAHAFLASRERPDLRLGEAADGGVWSLESEAFAPLSELLRAL